MSIKNSFAYAHHCEETRLARTALYNARRFKEFGNLKLWNALLVKAIGHASNARIWHKYAFSVQPSN